MSLMKRIKKTCRKCGKVSVVTPREQHCKHRNFGPRSYWCDGILDRVVRAPKPKISDVAAQGAAYRAKAEREMAQALKQRRKWDRAALKAKRLASKWSIRVEAATRRMAQSDEEIERQRSQREAALTTARQVQACRRRIFTAVGQPEECEA